MVGGFTLQGYTKDWIRQAELGHAKKHIMREHYHYFYNTKHSLVPAQCQKFQSGIVGIAGEPCAGSNTESVKIN